MEERKIETGEIRFLLDETRIQARELLRRELKRFNPVDLAEILEDLEPVEKVRLIEALDAEAAAEVLDETDSPSRDHVLGQLHPERISRIVEAMPPDEGADLVSQLPEDQQAQVLGAVEEEHAEDLKGLMRYPEDSAGGVMTTDFVTVPERATVAETLAQLRRETEMETIATVYAVDADQKITGVVSVRDLLEHDPADRLSVFMEREIVAVAPETDQEDVANLVSRYNLTAVPVVDAEKRILGIITVDDILDIIDEEVDEDMFRIAGTVSRDPSRERLTRKYLKRLPFLCTTFAGGALSVLIQYLFRFTTDQIVALTFFIPIILGFSGNVALQASTIMVRSFATNDIELRDVFRLLPLEAGTGALIGLTFGVACGLLTSLVGASFGATPWLGVVVGVAIAAGTTTAAVLGVLVPAFAEWVGVDPAISAGPFITTLIDSTSMTLYLGIATALFSLLR